MIQFLWYDFKEMWDKKILAAGRLMDPLCQQSTEQHMHPCCGPIYNRLLVMVHIYFAHRYILLRNIFFSEIYLAHKYIFDASMLGKEMFDMLLLTFLKLSW